jgi:hypothetical protein
MTSKVSNTFSIKSLSQATGVEENRLLAIDAVLDEQMIQWEAEQEECCVRFSENIHVRKTLASKDYTTEEIQACWYTAEENQRIHAHCFKEIRKMDEGSKLKDKKYCSRGLEGHTAGGEALKEENRLLAIDAVLDEQMIQWEEDICDEDAIADIYKRASYSCQVSANIVGLADYVDACSIRTSGRVLASRAA